jgi:anti-sigma factor RsiW
MNHELTCQELVELVTDYLEGLLPPSERARFEAHLAGCQGCTHYLEQAQQTIQIMGKLSEASLSAAARDELLQIFRDWKPDSSP